jgi:hypothetical protein
MDRLEFLLKDKKLKAREAEKITGESRFAVEIAKVRSELATQRINNLGLLN